VQNVIDAITGAVLEAEARGEPIGPDALTLLLRRYAALGRPDIRDALERALTGALEAPRSAADEAASAWLELFSEASAVADDERILAAVADQANAVRATWPARGSVAAAMRSVGACLAAGHILGGDARELTAAAVDELERVVCRVYQPGEALAGSLAHPDEPDGDLEDHVAAAAALLTAHVVTGRLPYSMLAEEVMQYALTHPTSGDFAARCEAARVLCRLALLHDDEEYRAAAVVARAGDYRAEARRVLDALSSSYAERGAGAAIYAIALDEFQHTS
jgi:hypothetical protein